MEEWNVDIISLLYKPLVGSMPIRLLRLHPGTPDDDLNAELIPTSIEEAEGQYEATLYTWGSPVDPQRMTCNGLNVIIQKNAFDMLSDLRRTDQARTVWIDAICIDQSNIEERASQVSIMHHIYRRAERVVIWLGKSDDYSTISMTYAASLDVPKLLKESKDISDSATNDWEIYTKKSYFFEPEEEKDPSPHPILGVALVKFINRPWFNRVWVQQEAALCRETRVTCGDQEVGWDNIFALAWMLLPRSIGLYPDYISDDPNRTLNNISAVENIQRRRRRLFGDLYQTRGELIFQPLISRLVNSSRFGATDPRDKLYSLQYFAEDADTWFDIDYGLPWQILYADVARRFLEHGILGFLKNAGKVRQKPDSMLPSWAPDFRDGNWGSNTMIEHPSWMPGGPKTDTSYDTPGKAAGSVHNLPKKQRKRLDLPKELKDFKDSRKALLQSYASFKSTMSDEIVYLADVLDDPFDVQATLCIVRNDLDHIKKLESQTYLSGESLPAAYVLTLILSSNHEQGIVDSQYASKNWNDWFQWLTDPHRGRETMPVLQYSIEASGALQSFRFAITKHGYFCLVPRDAQVHDVVSIFVGYQVGVVLRRWQPPSIRMGDGKAPEGSSKGAEAAEYFELIGDAYIHGMMTNQARCIIDEFNCKHDPTQPQVQAMMRASDSGHGVSWKTLGLSGGYARILETLGDHLVNMV
ncbi:heterokaryon incompatibility protein-domain-containing protein [Hypoxylon rubiginosum]|uniref:Heterokaryon incompatibility protein-domain-containing protein n=1 Tax=Hypoxylon rubiginosum TaxID=110542 RepID=A0ACB9Z8Z8_9PEZI|nr:heterokaryon incompatibility protein-domain-containing protein [Hypoxylon rubiginosum]